MKTIIHLGSGAVLGLTTRAPVFLPEGAGLIDGNLNSEDEWLDGQAIATREDAAVSLSPTQAAAGELMAIDMPADAWARFPDGSISADRSFVVPSGIKEVSVTLVGRYRGAATAPVIPASEAS